MQRTVDELVTALSEAHVPCGPINTLDKVFADPQVQNRGMQISVQHAKGYQVPLVANPVKFSATPISYPLAPPELGEHTELVLGR
jgi:crotonobetainyl-CoA:carnitine CoA-transferase CaiB-like acyl-CoA transferase